MGFEENKGQSGPLSFVSKTLAKANVSCQLNFRSICQLSVNPIQTLTFINTAAILFSLRKITAY